MVDSPGTPVCTNTVYANSGCWIPGPGVPGSLVPAFRILRSTGYNVTKLGILRANGFVISAIVNLWYYIEALRLSKLWSFQTALFV